jgi:flagellin-like protein
VYFLSRHFSNRAVSQIIAALLLIAIAVAAAILLYVFSIGLLGSLSATGGQQTREQVIMEAYSWSGATMTVTLRNVGTSAVDLASADYFVNSVQDTLATGCPATVSPGASCQETVHAPSLVFGATYPFKIVTPDGGVFSYSVTYGGTG